MERRFIQLFGMDDNGEIRGMTKKELDSTIFYLKKITKSISANIKKCRIYNGGKGYVCSARIQLPDHILDKIIETINLEI